MSIVKKYEGKTYQGTCGVCLQKKDDYQSLLQTNCCKTKKNENSIFHKKCLEKIAFRENKEENYFSCPNCKTKINKLDLFSRIQLVGFKILNFFANHLTLFKRSSSVFSAGVVVLSGIFVAKVTGVIGVALFSIAALGALLLGMEVGAEASISAVGLSEKLHKERLVIVISYSLGYIITVSLISIVASSILYL
ncbi:MAG: hypothetical protein K1060chlam5_00529 [Candidatus Anoxychlamydiales bacterium]|nr:hypothetical protein [Candidatus Anoxychlamydiales bacterium]